MNLTRSAASRVLANAIQPSSTWSEIASPISVSTTLLRRVVKNPHPAAFSNARRARLLAP
jgi:hypothetical protein